MGHTLTSRFALILSAALATSCTCGSDNKDKTDTPVAPLVAASGDVPDGLQMVLTEGALSRMASAKPKVAKTNILSGADVDALLARMPALETKAGDKKRFNLRAASKPAPRPGETIKSVFPGAGGPAVPQTESGPLKVVRYSPEGDVALAPHLAVTFSQPMVALTSHADNAQNVPVKLTPQPKGQWRWVGTKTILFDPDVRFPQATTYKVSVEAGVKSQSGAVLDTATTWTFSTPPLNVTNVYPGGGPHKLDPLVAIQFDQRINAQELLGHVFLEYGGNKHPLRLAQDTEIAADARAKAMVEQAAKNETTDRMLLLKPKATLPKATTINVLVRQGAPSAEGSRLTQSDQTRTFETYGPLFIKESRCDWGDKCPPRSGWRIEFSNPLDPEKLDPSAFKIEPKLDAKRISARGRYLYIRGLPVANTTYKVTVPSQLTDKFGQTLGADEDRRFSVGDAQPRLSGPSGLVVLDPYAKSPSLNVFSIGQDKLSVEIRKVQPSDYPAFIEFTRRWRDREPPSLPGKKVFSGTVDTAKGQDQLVETPIDLSKAFEGGLGHAAVIVKPVTWHNQYPPRIHTWVQSTKMGIDAAVDREKMLAFATDLKTGAPVSGVEITMEPAGVRATSAADGTATLELAASVPKSQILVARKDGDVAILPEPYSYRNRSQWYRREAGASLRTMVFDDRGMYKPGEEVHFKGWVRSRDGGIGGDLAMVSDLKQLNYRVKGPRDNEITKGKIDVNAMGGFDAKFTLPKTPNLGRARIELDRADTGVRVTSHSFQIQEFRRPEYEVTTTASPGPHTIGDRASVTAEAKYYSGGGLAAAPVNWTVTASPTSFSPPGHTEFTFGQWIPWWSYDSNSGSQNTQSIAGTTTSDGKHVVDIDFVSVKPAKPMSVVATARVSDVNRQAWSASSTLLVHPSDLYVGVKRERYFVGAGEPIEFEMIVADQEGVLKPGVKIDAEVVRLDWEWQNGRYKEKEVAPQSCAKTSAAEPVKCSVKPGDGGTYKVTATIVDDKGRSNQTSIRTWVSGGKRIPARNVELEKVELIPDAKEYKPGQTAEILVRAPFEDAEGIMTIRRSGIVRSERFTFGGTTHVLKVPLRDGDTPNLFVHVDVVGKAPRLDSSGKPSTKLPPRPAYGSGQIKLAIPPHHRTLKVDVTPAARKLEPGSETKVKVKVQDPSGAAVSGAEVAIVVVDESVLALSGYSTPNPISRFYGQRSTDTSDQRIRGFVKLAQPEVGALASAEPEALEEADDEAPMDMSAGPMGGAEGFAVAQTAAPAPPGRADMKREAKPRARGLAAAMGKRKQKDQQPNTPIAVRTNFNALATFAPTEITNADGVAEVAVKLPDNLTRYRVMAIATGGPRRYGSSESSITARMPLMVRPSPPRFLNFGDEFELPIVVQNQTDDAIDVQIAVRTVNAMLTQGAGRSLKVPANDRLEVRFPTKALMPGTARFQVGVSAGKFADAKTFEMPVYTPATTEAFATYGTVGDDEGDSILQKVAKPSNVVDEFGGLEITTSSTQLAALTDAVLYLHRYPYECAEQLSSRVLAIAGLRDVLAAFEADGLPSPAALERSMGKDMERLRNIQNPSGGFGFWNWRDNPWPYLTVHVTHALARAKAKGYSVPAQMLANAHARIKVIENYIPHFYSLQARQTIIAYSLYVRKQLGDLDMAKAKSTLSTGGVDKLPVEALGWLLYTLGGQGGASSEVDSIIRRLDNSATETAGSATFATAMSDGAHLILHSNRRVDAIVLEALLEAKPKHDLIPKVVRALLAHRKRGKWQNTQENVFVLLAMDRYFAEYEKVTPNFVARAWLGDRFAGDHRFRGRTTERHRVDVPMAELKSGGEDLVLQRDGSGRLYYRLGMRYAPSDLKLAPADHGFSVQRTYEGVDDPADVTRRGDGTWVIKAGARVRVRVTMVAESRRHHVALVDPLPAGLEPLNPALKVTGALPTDPSAQTSRYWWWSRTWYEHQNMRDERVEAFASMLWAGVHKYSYVASATTPGNFVVPPAKAEEMYAPETFGRSGTDRVIIE